jgi:hypothetical protein
MFSVVAVIAGNSKMLIRNNIFSRNAAALTGYEQEFVDTTSAEQVKYNILSSNSDAAYDNADKNISATEYFKIAANGTAVGKGDASLYLTNRYPLKEMHSTERPYCGIVDLGAYQITNSGANPLPTLSHDPLPGLVCNGDAIKLFVSDTNDKLEWRLYYNNKNSGSYQDWKVVLNTDNFIFAHVFDSGYYRVGHKGICPDMKGYSDSVFVNVGLAPTTVFDDTVLCYGSAFKGKNYLTDTILRDTVYKDGCISSYSNFSITFFKPVDTLFLTDTLCYGETYVKNGFNSGVTGISYHTVKNLLGCDSTLKLNLVVLSQIPINDLGAHTLCNSETFEFNGRQLDSAGVYYDTLHSSLTGCDSVIRVSIVTSKSDTTHLVDSRCYGNPYLYNGFNEQCITAGTDTLYNIVQGITCTNVVQLILTVYPKVDTLKLNAVRCFGEVYDSNGFNITATVSGTHYLSFKNTNNCDSIVQLNLIVFKIDTTIIYDTIRKGATYSFGGIELDTCGVYYHTLSSSLTNCDSIIKLYLDLQPAPAVIIDNGSVFICHGDSVSFRSKTLTASGIYTDTAHYIYNDTIYTINLTVSPAPKILIYTDTLCYGEIYVDRRFNEDSSGTYEYIVKSVEGCDSLIYRLNLYIRPHPDTLRLNETLCYGQTYNDYGFFTNVSGIHTRTIQNEFDCDSVIIILDLKITSKSKPVNGGTVTLCPNEEYIFGKDTLRNTGVYVFHLESSKGCDSAVKISIVRINRDTLEISKTLCYGQVYDDYDVHTDSSGTYEKLFKCHNGEDSMLVIVHINILPAVDTIKITDTIFVDEKYTDYGFVLQFADTGTYYYNKIIDNPEGCDSIISLTLVCIDSLTSIDNIFDTVYTCIYGKVYGLDAAQLPVRIYYSASGLPLSYIMSDATLGSDGGASWSLCNVIVGSHISLFAETKEGYFVHEFYDRIPVSDTLRGLNFNYDSIPSDYHLATGIIYVENVATEGVLVHYAIDNSEGWVVSMSNGEYQIALHDSTSLNINPTVIAGYDVTPKEYTLNYVNSDVSGLDFNYYRFADSSKLRSVCGSLVGLDKVTQYRQVVSYIVDGVIGYAVTDINGLFCIDNLPESSVAVVVAPDIAGYTANPLSQTVIITSDTVLAPFVYSRVVKDAITLCGNISGLPDNSNVAVIYTVNTSWYNIILSDTNGNYCISAESGDYVRIIGSVVQGYNANPQMYSFNADSGSSKTSYDFVYSAISAGLLSINGMVMKDSLYYAGAPLSYTVNDSVKGSLYVNAFGMYHLQELDSGSNIIITPGYLKGYTITPNMHTVLNLQKDTVLDTIIYTRSICPNNYSIKGTLYGLPAALRENRAVEYSVDSVSSVIPALTSVAGNYIIDSLCSGSSAIVYAPAVVGYDAYPPYYNVELLSDYYALNFVYVKSHVAPEIDTVYITSVIINGVEQVVSDTIHYVLPCGSDLTSVDVVFNVSVSDTCYDYSGTGMEREYRYTVDLSRKAVYHVETVVLESTSSSNVAAGGLTHTYCIIVERRFEFYEIVSEFFDNAFVVNNNPATNEGYSFVWYQWYRDEIPVGNEQDYSAGVTALFSHNPNSLYRVEMLTEDGTPLRTCAGKSGTTVDYSSIYPNPAPASGKVYFTNVKSLENYTHAVLYSFTGAVLWQGSPSSLSINGLTVPGNSGTYVLILYGGRNDIKKYKLVVK